MTAVATMPDALAPGGTTWRGLMTASKVAGALGLSPYDSPLSLWHEMRGDVDEPDGPNKVQRRGHYLEPAILAWWRDEHPEYSSLEEQVRLTRAGLPWALATPDGLATGEGVPPLIVEAKSAANPAEWGDEGTDLIPIHYLTQVYWQLHMAQDLDPAPLEARVAVITAGLRFAEYVVTYDPAIGADLEDRCWAFVKSLGSDVPPAIDDHVATLDVLRRLHPDIDREAEAVCDEETATEYLTALAASKTAAARERAAKSKVLDVMGDARVLTCGGLRIARRQPNRSGVSLVATVTLDDLTGDPA